MSSLEKPRQELDTAGWVREQPRVMAVSSMPHIVDSHPELKGAEYFAMVPFSKKSLSSDKIEKPLETKPSLDEILTYLKGVDTYCVSTRVVPLGSTIPVSEIMDAGVSNSAFLGTLKRDRFGTVPKDTVKTENLSHTDYGQAYLKHLLGDEHQPDENNTYIRHHALTSEKSQNYLALKLVRELEPNISPQGVDNFFKELEDKGLSFEKIKTIESLFDSMGSKSNIDALIKKGLIDESQVDRFLQKVAGWNLAISIYKTKHSENSSEFFPFTHGSYDVRYLPHLVNTVNNYLEALPDILKQGRTYHMPSINIKLAEFRIICEQILVQQKGMFDKDTIKDILTQVNVGLAKLSDTHTEMLATGSFNKRRATLPTYGELPSSDKTQETIRSYGGRAPRHLGIKRKFGVRKGEI